MDLSQLIYISRATSPPTREELAEIVAQSKPNNWRQSITGLLLYGRGHYLQLLEGPLLEVAELYTRISRDPRHDQVLPLLLQPATRRLFPEWKMGVLNLDAGPVEDSKRLPLLMRAIYERQDPTRHAGMLALDLIRAFVDRKHDSGR